MSKLPRLTGRFLAAGAALAAIAPSASAFTPNDPYFFYNPKSPSLPGQWHLVNTAPVSAKNAGLDMNIQGAWTADITGAGVVIGIIDDGVDGTHEDLKDNYRADLSKNFSSNAAIAGAPQGPQTIFDMHGQAVAGVAAARGGNKTGVTGASPYAQIAGQRISFGSDGYPITTGDMVDAFLWKSGAQLNGSAARYVSEAQIHVSNNSWGPTTPFQQKDVSPVQAIEAASLNNTIFLFAAANSRGTANQQTNAQERNGAEAVITIAAVNATGVYSSYSNWGSCVFASALSNEIDGSTDFGITTTDRSNGYGYNSVTGSIDGDAHPNLNYTSTFGGTSSATPLASGIIALGKQVAPAMDTRMAKHLLARTSRVIDADDNTAASAGYWVTNGAGLHFNPNYGFGLIDATAFVNAAQATAFVTDRTAVSRSASINKSIITTGGVTQAFAFANSSLMQKVESVEVAVNVSGADFYRDFQLSIVSPSNTTSYLYRFDDSPAAAGFADYVNQSTNGTLDWTFTSNAFWGENAVGTWTVNATGRGTDKVWKSATVTLNMGDIVMESGTMVLGANVKAHSLNLDYSDSAFIVPTGKTFTVTDSVNIYAGSVTVAGTLTEGNPETAPGWNKLSKITVGSEASLRVLAGGSVSATRGIDAKGGLVRIEEATSVSAAGGIRLSARASLVADKDLSTGGALDVTGASTASIGKDATFTAVTLADTGSLIDVKGNLTASTALTMTGGELRVGGNITTAKFDMSGGVFAPGGAGKVGTSSITGAVNLTGSAIVLADIRGTDTSGGAAHDKIVVSGLTTLDGATLVINTLDGAVIKNGESVKLIEGAVTGTFADIVVSGNKAFLNFEQNAADAGTLDAKVNFTKGTERLGGSANMRAVAGLLDNQIATSGAHAGDLVAAAESASGADQAVALLSAFIPDNGLALANGALATANAITGSYTAHASRLRSGDINASNFWANPLFESYSFEFSGNAPLLASNGAAYMPLFGYDDTSTSIWVNGNASSRKTETSRKNNLVESDDTSLGAAVGVDYRLTSRYASDIRAGIFAALQSGETELGASGAKSTTDTTSIAPGLYISGQAEGFEFDLMGAIATSDYTLERDIVAIGSTPASTAKADTDGLQSIVRAGVSHRGYLKSGVFFGPDLALTYRHGTIDGYTEETAGIAGLTVAKQTFDSLVSTAGMTLGKQCNLDSVALLPMLNVAWEHEFLDRTDSVGVSSNTLGTAFNYKAATPELGADTLLVGASVAMLVSENTRFTVGYEGRFLREGMDADHRATATFTMNF